MTHHGNAVWLGGDCLAELVRHHADVPAGEDVINRRTEIRLGLFGAIEDDRGEQIARVSAGEETEVDSGSPGCRRSLKRRGVRTPLPPPGERHRRPRGARTQQCSSIQPARKCAHAVEFLFRHDSLLRISKETLPTATYRPAPTRKPGPHATTSFRLDRNFRCGAA